MALSSFLNEGAEIPAGSAVKSMTTQTVLPDWYTNYTQQLLSSQQALSQRPYTPYQGPRVADFSPQQQQAFDMTGQAATAWQPGMAAAQGTAGAAGALSGAGAAQPYFQQAQGLDPSKTAAGDYSSARDLALKAAGMSGAGAANPYFQQGVNTATGAVNSGGGLAAAQPFLNTAGGDVTDVNSYMNPYITSVVDRIGELGQRNLVDNLMPALEGRYIKSGQFRGSGQMTDTMRALRDTSADILGKQSEALMGGYSTAQQAKLADLARQAGLAGTAGNLGTAQQDAALRAAGLQTDVGKSLGSLTGQDQQAQLSASGALGNLGTAAAGLTAAQQKMLADMGVNLGQLTGTDASNKAQLAALQASMAGQSQSLGLAGAGALGEVGKQQQTQAQGNLDIAYADFLKQQGYPQEQINNMLATFKGIGVDSIPKAVTEQGILPGGDNTTQPGSLQSAASIAAALAGLAKDSGIFK